LPAALWGVAGVLLSQWTNPVPRKLVPRKLVGLARPTVGRGESGDMTLAFLRVSSAAFGAGTGVASDDGWAPLWPRQSPLHTCPAADCACPLPSRTLQEAVRKQGDKMESALGRGVSVNAAHACLRWAGLEEGAMGG
jgi:hypothetical protein